MGGRRKFSVTQEKGGREKKDVGANVNTIDIRSSGVSAEGDGGTVPKRTKQMIFTHCL